LALRPAVFDPNVAALNIAGFGQALAERVQPARPPVRRYGAEEADYRHCRLLCVRHQRPSSRAADQRDELATVQLTDLHALAQLRMLGSIA